MENELKEFMAKMTGEFQVMQMRMHKEELALKEQFVKEVPCSTINDFLQALAR